MAKYLSILLIGFIFHTFIFEPGALSASTFKLASVSVEGNNRLSDEAIVNYSRLVSGSNISSEDLNFAYTKVLDTGLFKNVEFKQNNRNLLILVEEFPTVNEISFEGNKKFTDEKLLSFLTIKPRFVFTPKSLDVDLKSIQGLYRNSGRISARIQPRVIELPDNRINLIFEIYEGSIVEIERIGFVGNRVFKDSRLRRVLESKQAGSLRLFVGRDILINDRIELDKKLLRDFYKSRGFADFSILDVNAELSEEKDAFFIIYNIKEGPQFTIGEIKLSASNTKIPTADFKKSIDLKTGEVFSAEAIEIEAKKIEERIKRLGFEFIRVKVKPLRDILTLTMDLEFVFESGERIFIERIDISGNTATYDRVIRRQFFLVEGDPFNPREIRAASERIRALGLFSDVSVNIKPGSSAEEVVLDIDVKEKPTGTLSFGAGYSSGSGIGGLLEYSEKNFLGRGQSLSLSLRATSGDQLYDVKFYEPMFLRNDLGFGTSFSIKDTSKQNADYDTANIQLKPFVTYPVGEKSKMRLEYAISQTELRNPGEIGDIITNEVNEGKVTSSSIGYMYSYDTRLFKLGPKSGFILNFGQNFSGLGGDKTSLKSTAKIVAQRDTLNEELKLTGVVEAGILSYTQGNSRVMDRFFLGSSKMRGFKPDGLGPRECLNKQCRSGDDDALGGERFAVIRLEAEFPLGLPEEYGLSGGLFYDIGNLWSLSQINDNVLYAEGAWRQTVGASIFWKTPIGPLRFNFTDTLQKEIYDKDESFDLTISTRF